MYKKIFKRFIDIILSLIGILILSPVIVSVAVFLFIANKGKVFFIQARPGLNSRIFKIIKFKTMNDNRNKNGELLSDDERLTTVGKIVRKLSLDEILQLINVLKGDMSLIGPRPLLPSYLPLYNEEQSRRHDVKPGITGWAQINGRNAISWSEKFKLDVWYVENLSFWLDVKIFFFTIKKVFISEGISQEGQATMGVFEGNGHE
ncbi:lipopolysaccharide/colanic/teichoic acid biosynthesis glycosyltransferase [Mucilaginibacter yixingensis]|uniref:Lipopolysaccharide/colanic/teichoic acid biosynthesis glycosyltransferase n=1 Tax=Mucilaginibacter yixingensis TaxID=1295612 RepID=A0A2T5JGM1_9SPHI|nr:sugar transferase [Mucilaginibacter yixingensis]PTR01592.1 lipopolysaccharide/colanic/teichoic acid biosynthesis glycosyltransferase [Mucilaginibacter yixingensis]